ncbi:MAG: hypothetical protein MMC33_007709 [Icmadophila ericetorum]|nr:hypothetical protein [Icmadophila ericetorum]
MESLSKEIMGRVSRAYQPYIYTSSTVHKMLVTLKQQLAPSDQSRINALRKRYNDALRSPRSQNMETWNQGHFDFLNAIADINPTFYNSWLQKLTKKELKTKDAPSFKTMLESFRDAQRIIDNSGSTKSTASAFVASFQNEKQPESSNSRENKPDPEISEEIKNVLKRGGSIKTAVDYAISNTKRDAKRYSKKDSRTLPEKSEKSDEVAASLIVMHTMDNDEKQVVYPLRDSLILDSGATVHVCNNPHRVTNVRPTKGKDTI